MKTIETIKPSEPQKLTRTRVAAYARVSTADELNYNSLSAQIDYYTKKINQQPRWKNVGIFTDYGLTGTKTERPGFKSLLKLCDEGKVDLVLVKSISRFCRNTTDLLITIRHLKDLDINVHFEKENVDTISSEGELMITLLASFAQEESRSISENTRWAIHKRFEQGIGNSHTLYGYKWNGSDYITVDEQAEIVKEIFSMYLAGSTPGEIALSLRSRKILSTRGHQFSDRQVACILRQEKFTGNSMLQKTYCKDFIERKYRKNNGEAPRYFAEETHPQIISQETFDAVQQEIVRRRELGYLANHSISFSCFTSKVICSHCGRTYRKRMSGMKNRHTKTYRWICGNKIEHTSSACNAQNVSDTILHSLTAEVLGTDQFTKEDFDSVIDHIEVAGTNTLIFKLRDGSSITKTWNTKEEKNGEICNADSGITDKVLIKAN